MFGLVLTPRDFYYRGYRNNSNDKRFYVALYGRLFWGTEIVDNLICATQLFDKWMQEQGLLNPEVRSAFVTCGDWDLQTMWDAVITQLLS